MYHFIVKQKIRNGFQSMSQGNYEAVLQLFDEQVHFSFSGNHAISGNYHNLKAVRQWFERVYRIFPDIRFEVNNVIVSGMPWNTTVATQFTVRATLKDGRSYQNAGVQILRLRWGRIVEDHLYEDTQKLVLELNHQGQLGVQEALAAPIAG